MAEREMPSYNEQSNGRKSQMAMNKEFRSEMIPPEGTNEAAWWFAFRADRLLVHEDSSSLRIPRVVNFSDLGLAASSIHYLGLLDGRRCYAVELHDDVTAPRGMTFKGKFTTKWMKTSSGWRRGPFKSSSGRELTGSAAGAGFGQNPRRRNERRFHFSYGTKT